MLTLLDGTREPLPLVALQTVEYLRFGPRRTWGTFRATMADCPEDRFPAIAVPSLVVRGGRDPIVGQSWAEEVTRRLERGQMVVIPGAAHAVTYNAANALAGLVTAFIAESVQV